MEMFELAEKLKELREKEAQLKGELSEVRDQLNDTMNRLTEQMVNQEIQNFSRNGLQFYLSTRVHVNDVAARREELYEKLKEQGYGDIVKETVHPSTLKAFVRELKEEHDDELPEWLEGLVRIYEEDEVRVKKI